jgi:protein-tyrosine phosphatase
VCIAGSYADDPPGRLGCVAAPYRVCFVCLGNICRSPMAESVFRRRLEEAGLDGAVEVDSAGTGPWHVGERVDSRAAATLRRRGYAAEHIAWQFRRESFAGCDLIVALDRGHLQELRELAPDPAAAERVRLLRSFDPSSRGDGDLDVPDPYYGRDRGFDESLDLIEPACAGLLEVVRQAVRA